MTDPLSSDEIVEELRHTYPASGGPCLELTAADCIGRLQRELEAAQASANDMYAGQHRLQRELDKAKTMPMKYRRMKFNAQLQNENDRLHGALERISRDEFSSEYEGGSDKDYEADYWRVVNTAREALGPAQEVTP